MATPIPSRVRLRDLLCKRAVGTGGPGFKASTKTPPRLIVGDPMRTASFDTARKATYESLRLQGLRMKLNRMRLGDDFHALPTVGSIPRRISDPAPKSRFA